jgi:LacI family transcriptional regulator
MMPTLIDVSKYSGFSTTTVSKVMNHDISISEETRKKVLSVIEELKYVPNETARRLKLGKYKKAGRKDLKTLNIGCLTFRNFDKFSHPYFSLILDGIDRELTGQKQRLSYIYSSKELELDSALFSELINPESIDGLIIIKCVDSRLMDRIEKEIKSLVFVDTLYDNFDSIDVDRERNAYESVKYLAGAGHRKIAYVGTTRDERFDGYRKALSEMGLEFDEKIAGGAKDYQIEDGYINMKNILVISNPVPTAVFAACDQLAIGAMKAIKEKGLKIPDDISVIGHDDIRESGIINPALTTVRIEKEEMGRMAARRLIDRIRNPEIMPVKIIVPGKLVIRESTGKASR